MRGRTSLSLCALVGLLLSLAGPLPGQTEHELATAVNVAGRQRMLTQKMTKEACLIALKVDVDANRERLQQTMAVFDSALVRLLEGDLANDLPAPADFIKAQLELVRKIWDEFRVLLTSAVEGDLGALRAVAQDNLVLLREANAAVGMYLDVALMAGARDLGRVVNIAGRQRMLSQKMAKEVCLLALGIRASDQRAQLGRTFAIFERSHSGLIDGDLEYGLAATEDPEIRAQMARVHLSWLELSPLVERALAGETLAAEALHSLDAAALRLLEQMDNAVGMYEALARR